jgi:hypothetical protein
MYITAMNSPRSHLETGSNSGDPPPRTHHLAIMPDGNKPVALGSGVITSILGEGGAAVVYEIWIEQLGIKRAVKMLKPSAIREISNLFESEMKLTAQLRHPNIVEIHTVGVWENLPYIEMEKIDGSSLRRLIIHHGALPLEVCTAIGIVICEVLEFVHNQEFVYNGAKHRGILHHDLKPENIMLTHKGNLKLMDFGISTPGTMSGNIIPGKLVGSLHYLSPEVLEGKNIDKRSDIFSFGCILYNCITGVKAFSESRVRELVEQRYSNNYVPVNTLRKGVPAKLRNLLDRCLKTNPDDRYADTGSIAKALKKIHRNLTRLSAAETLVAFMRMPDKNNLARFRKNRTLNFAMAVSLTLLLTTVAVVVFLHRTPKLPVAPPPAIVEVVKAVPMPAKEHTSQLPAKQPSPQLPTMSPSPQLPNKSLAVQRKRVRMGWNAPLKTDVAEVTNKPPTPIVNSSLIPNTPQDPLAALKLAAVAQKYGEVLSIYATLSPDLASRKSAIIFRLQALVALKYTNAALAVTNQTTVEDAEFYLLKARVLYENGDYRSAFASLRRCSSLPTEFIDRETLTRESQYYTALCLSSFYDEDQSDASRQKALNCWFDVKYTYRSTQNDNRFIIANSYIRQLSKKK